MAIEFVDGSWQDTRSQQDRIDAHDSPAGSTRYNGTSGRIDVAQGIDVAERERAARAAAAASNIDYHPSDLEGFLRNTGYQTGGTDVDTAWGNLLENYRQRANNTPGAEHQSSSNERVSFNDDASRAAAGSSPFFPGSLTGGGQGASSRGAFSGQANDNRTGQPYTPMTPELLAAAQAFGSPLEAAVGQRGDAAGEELMKASDAFYALPADQQAEVGRTINWYDPASYRSLLGPSQAPPAAAAAAGGGGAGGGTGSSGSSAGSRPAFQNTSPRFDDPATRLVEDTALARMQSRTNPDPNSGTALFEKYARELIETLRGPVYSASDEAIIKTQAFDNIQREEDATIQQWIELTSQRGLTPSSGPVLDGILKIKNQYRGLRTTVEAQFARDAIAQTRVQRTQVLDTAGQLANSEESRLREALTLAGVPLSLHNDSFARNMQLLNAAGSPTQYLNTLMQTWQAGNQQNQIDSNNRAGTAMALLEYLANVLPTGRAA